MRVFGVYGIEDIAPLRVAAPAGVPAAAASSEIGIELVSWSAGPGIVQSISPEDGLTAGGYWAEMVPLDRPRRGLVLGLGGATLVRRVSSAGHAVWGRVAVAMVLAGERVEAERDGVVAANRAYEDDRAGGREKTGRRFGRGPKAWVAPAVPEGVVSVSDPDSQRMKANLGYVQGYNAQAVVDEGQIVLAAEITNTPGDFSNLDPMITATLAELERVGIAERPQVALADAQYWNEQHMDEVIANKHIQVLVRPDSSGRTAPRPGWTGGRYSWMRTVLASEHGKGPYRKRMQMIEPVFAHTKHNRLITRFHRRGRAAVRTEWRLLMATHNLTKLHRHQLASAGA